MDGKIETRPRRIPLEDFFRKPERVMVRLSPDGGFLAYLAPYERRLNLYVQDMDKGQVTRVTSATERDLGGYTWVNDRRLVFVQDTGGDENFRLFAVDRDGSNPLDLTPFDDVKCSIVDDLEDNEEQILFEMNRRDPEVFDVYRLDVNTGQLELIAENPGNIGGWMTDHQGRLRLATTTDGVNTSILYRPTESDAWRAIATYDFKEAAQPLFFTYDNQAVYVSSNVGRDKSAIFEFDLETGKEGRLVFEHPEVDVHALLGSKKRKVITGVAFETWRREYRFFDQSRERHQRFLEAKFPGYDVGLTSHSRDESRFTVYVGSDRTLGAYHLLDAESLRVEKLFDLSPWLEEEEMAPMRPISYPSRDGLTIRGYLTTPRGATERQLPLIINPHGGPWVRDSWGFQPQVQFLANRGYAVLQMNYRGSTGYGREFWESSFGQWGLKMQDDISDGVAWAVESGVADPKRVAIYGGSYGGYAALAGLTQTPELYACGVSYVGVSSIFTMMATVPPYWKPYLEMLYEMVGHPEKDEERLRETSPLFHADRIKAPVFVAQGANDPRVKKQESDQIVEALRERGLPVEYLVKENEGHGFHNEENQYEFYRAMERFLSEHLKPQ